jgi:DNA-binding winged helix-turn-helix (wHTH) protein/TolB-like protein/Flp pilus assembly protein TadD
MMIKLGPWLINEDANLLSRDGKDVRIEKRVMSVLMELAIAKGQVVTKEALINVVWNGAAVSDHSVANAISDLRRALGDDRRNPQYIETIPKRGYRLIADISDAPGCPPRGKGPNPNVKRSWQIAVLAASLGVISILVIWLAPMNNEAPRLFLANIENVTNDPAWSLGGETATEMLTVALAGGKYRLVRWRAYDLNALADELKPAKNDRLLRGRIIVDGDALFLSLQLVDLADGASTWANSYELGAENFSTLTQDIAVDLKIPLGLAKPQQGFADVSPAILEAYWRARYLWSLREHNAIREALRILSDITEQAPDFAPGHAALADIYAHKSAEELALDRSATYPIAEQHLARAFALNPKLPDAFITSAYLRFFKDRDVSAAMVEIEKAIQLRPETALAWQTKAMIANASGNFRESIIAIDKARNLDPLSASILWDKVWFLYIAGEYNAALIATERARRVSAPVVIYEALIHTALGDYDAALASWLERAKSHGLPESTQENILAIAQAEGSYTALTALTEITLGATGYEEHAIPLAALLIAVENTDAAIAVLDADRPQEKSWWWSWYEVIPAFDDIRSEQQLSNITERKVSGSGE